MLRPLKLNDNLNNMTLFFTFPNNFYKTDGETLFTTNNNNQIYSIYSNNIYRIYSNFNNNLVKLYEITRDNLNDGSGANININELKLDDIDDIIVELNSNVSFNNYINIDDGKAKYTIIIDKQPRDNPSSDKKEITLILEHPLLKRGDINDELIIQNGKCIISRKLELTNDNNIKVLDEPYEEIIENINLDLFLGDNYIYILEENYMPLYIKYLTHNDLNTAYATKLELTSSITQTSTNIMLEVSKKTDKEEIISTINQSAEEIQINANKVSLAGKTIELTSENIKIDSTNFQVDKNGNMNCNNGNFKGTISGSEIIGGTIALESETSNTYRFKINDKSVSGRYIECSGASQRFWDSGIAKITLLSTMSSGLVGCASTDGSQATLSSAGVSTSSDIRFKENIIEIPKETSKNLITNINPIEYTFINSNRKHRGLSAQEVEEVLNNNNVFNEIYEIDENGKYSLNYVELIPDLINCIKDLYNINEKLKQKIIKMESDYNA